LSNGWRRGWGKWQVANDKLEGGGQSLEAFQTLETSKKVSGKLSRLWKPPKKSQLSFPDSGNLQKSFNQAFQTLETSKKVSGKLSKLWKPLKKFQASFPDSGNFQKSLRQGF
jgi:hypothetical protein